MLPPCGHQRARQRLPAEHEGVGAQRLRRAVQQLVQQAQVGGRPFNQAERLRDLAQGGAEAFKLGGFGQKEHRFANQERGKEVGNRAVEAERGIDRNAAAGSHRVGSHAPTQIIHHALVGKLYPFGLSGGAGGVDDIGQVVWRNGYRWVGR